MVELVDEPKRTVARGAALGFVLAAYVLAQDADLAPGRLIQAAEQVQQRALARTRGPDDRNALPDRDVEIDAQQHRHFDLALKIALVQAAAGNDRFTHSAAPRRD